MIKSNLVVGTLLLLFLSFGLCAHAQEISPKRDMHCEDSVKLKPSVENISLQTVDPMLLQSFFPLNAHLSSISPVCTVDLPPGVLYTNTQKTTVLSFSYQSTPYRPRIFQWDSTSHSWKALLTNMDRTVNTVSVELKDPRGVFGVFVDSSDAYEGTASWYAHKRYPAGAATNLFPLGTKLKVTNLANKKSTVVTITSTWTQTNAQRVIDLVSTAFKKIASLGEGLIHVQLDRLN